MATGPIEECTKGFQRACERRKGWEPLWQECLRFGQPARSQASRSGPSRRPANDLFDATAADGIEQLAASLLSELAPPWSRWFAIAPAANVDPVLNDQIAPALHEATQKLQSHFDRSNFAVELHQALLDVVTVGTATLLLEEAPAGSRSAFRFTSVPAHEVFIDGSGNGAIDKQYRKTSASLADLSQRFPDACDWESIRKDMPGNKDMDLELVEVVARNREGYAYTAYTSALSGKLQEPIRLKEGSFETSPLITFRWIKGAGEIYGRSPLMSALPDVKTANKVVELILKNASIAVTGIWLAEDDGVLNPANISLVPGSIIPKAAGSSGLTPLQSPGRLDVSQLILDDLRSRIRQTLMVDRLGPAKSGNMTATEVMERSAEANRLLGAIYGRLQAELLTPLLERAVSILVRRNEIPPIKLDGVVADIQYLSPLARMQSREDLRNVLIWLDAIGKIRSSGDVVDQQAAARWIANNLGVPTELMNNQIGLDDVLLQAIEETL